MTKSTAEHQAEEMKLTQTYEVADRTYIETLKMYDDDMKGHMEELGNAKKVYLEKNHEKNQLREEWE